MLFYSYFKTLVGKEVLSLPPMPSSPPPCRTPFMWECWCRQQGPVRPCTGDSHTAPTAMTRSDTRSRLQAISGLLRSVSVTEPATRLLAVCCLRVRRAVGSMLCCGR